MRITLAAIGRAKPGPELDLCAQYQKRCGWPITIKEINARSGTLPTDQRKQDEGSKLLAATSDADLCIALDERGKTYSSAAFTALLQSYGEQGESRVAFIIGGADGHAPETLQHCRHTLAFGPATWPHMLVRAMLCEQLYRAWSIHSNHPYHRS